jgi:CheY-like chemotaxis protein
MAVDLAMPILVVEDSKTMGQIIRNLLMLIGFRQIENISDGTTALAKLREKKFYGDRRVDGCKRCGRKGCRGQRLHRQAIYGRNT